MAKITLSNLGAGTAFQNAITPINTNNDTIEAAWENNLSRDGTSPNEMLSNLDMNSNRVLNLPLPVNTSEPLRLGDITSVDGTFITGTTGTSGHTVPYLDGNNTWSGTNTYTSSSIFNGSSTFSGSITNTGRWIWSGTPTYDLASNLLGVAQLFSLNSSSQSLAASKEWNGVRFSQADGQNHDWTLAANSVASNLYSNLNATSSSSASSNAYGAILHATNAGPGNVRGAHLGGFATTGSTGFLSAAALQIEPVSTSAGAWGGFASLTSSGANGIAIGYGIETLGDTYSIGFGSVIAPVGYTNAVYRAWMATASSANARGFQLLDNAGSEIAYWDKVGNIVANSIKVQSSNILATVTGSGTSIVSDTQPTINTKLTVTGGTLAADAQVLAVTATQPATPTATQNAVSYTITGNGSASFNNRAFLITYAAGYTGASSTDGIVVVNSNAGTSSTLVPAAGSNTTAGNRGSTFAVNGTTTGANYGQVGTASGGDINAGMVGVAQAVKNSAKNFGVVGTAINTGTSPVQIGGFFSLNQTTVPSVSAALIADNGAQTDPIVRFRDNGTDVFTVADGGAVSATSSIKSTGATAGVGYGTGAGGTVTQATSKATGVTLNTVTGAITMNNAALAAATIVSFVLTNSAVAATDLIVAMHESGGTLGSYTINARATGSGTAAIDVRNNTGGSLSEAIVD